MSKKNYQFTALVEMLRDINLTKAQLRQTHAEIRSKGEMYSESYQQQLINKATETAQEKLLKICDDCDPIIADLAANIEKNRVTLNLADPRLQNAISLASAPGAKDIGMEAQEAIIRPFLDNKDALNALMPLLKNSGMVFAAQSVERALKGLNRASNFLNAVGDNVYYATRSVSDAHTTHDMLNEAGNFAKIHDLEMPEMSEEYFNVVNRAAMGLV